MSRDLIKSALSTVIASGLVLSGSQVFADNKMSMTVKVPKGMEKCFGIVKAGMNDCGTPTNNGCSGSTKTDNDKTAWIFLPTGTCKKIVGGSTTD